MMMLNYLKITPWKNTRVYQIEHKVNVLERGITKQSEVSYKWNIMPIYPLKDNKFLWSIDRTDFFINNNPPRTPHMEMIVGLESSLYPVQVWVDDLGRFSKINNYNIWHNQWDKKVENLMSNFQGSFTDSFFENFRNEVKKEEALTQKLFGQSIFSLMFFSPQIDCPIKENSTVEKLIWNPLKLGQYTFTGEFVAEKIESESIVKTRFKHESTPERLLTQAINKLLGYKELSADFIYSEDIQIKIDLTNCYSPDSGLPISKDIKIEIWSLKKKDYHYTETMNVKFEGIKLAHSQKPIEENKFSFFVSERDID